MFLYLCPQNANRQIPSSRLMQLMDTKCGVISVLHCISLSDLFAPHPFTYALNKTAKSNSECPHSYLQSVPHKQKVTLLILSLNWRTGFILTLIHTLTIQIFVQTFLSDLFHFYHGGRTTLPLYVGWSLFCISYYCITSYYAITILYNSFRFSVFL